MALSCDELRGLLDEEGALDTVPAREHLDSCAECRRVVARWRAVESQLQECGKEEPPPFLHARIMAHVRAARGSSPRLLGRLWWIPTLATALLIAALGLWRSPLDAPDTKAVPPAPTAPRTATTAPLPTAPARRDTAPARRTPTTAGLPADQGPVRGAPGPADSAIACTLVGPEGTASHRSLALEPHSAPGPGVTWSVLVAPNGTVRPAVEGEALPFEPLERLASMNLEAGRYTLQCLPER